MEANYFTILYWFCHIFTWIGHGCTCVPLPETPSHLPPHPIPQGHPSAPSLSTLSHALNLDWRSISHMIIYFASLCPPHPPPPHPQPHNSSCCWEDDNLNFCLYLHVIGFSKWFVAEEDECLVTGVFKGAESKEQRLRKAISLIKVLRRPSPDSWVCVAKSLCCSPDTITTLLSGYTPIQNVFGIKKIKIKLKKTQWKFICISWLCLSKTRCSGYLFLSNRPQKPWLTKTFTLLRNLWGGQFHGTSSSLLH